MTTFIPEVPTAVTPGVLARIYDTHSLADLLAELRDAIPQDSSSSPSDRQHPDPEIDVVALAHAGRLPELTALLRILSHYGCALAVIPAANGHPVGYGRPWTEFS